MKDPIKPVKEAYRNLLSGILTANGSAVDFFIGEADKARSQQYVVLNIASTQLIPNKDVFAHEVTVTLDIYAKMQVLSQDPYATVDVIAQQILDAVVISTRQTGLDFTGTGFSEVSMVRLDSTSYDGAEDTGNVKVAKRSLQFIQLLNQS